jgi:hypothetical protein
MRTVILKTADWDAGNKPLIAWWSGQLTNALRLAGPSVRHAALWHVRERRYVQGIVRPAR